MIMKKYLITESRLQELLEAEATLIALECGGVDNWDWYSESISEHYEEPTIEEALNLGAITQV